MENAILSGKIQVNPHPKIEKINRESSPFSSITLSHLQISCSFSQSVLAKLLQRLFQFNESGLFFLNKIPLNPKKGCKIFKKS
jgi:hypothetical protein